VVCSTLLIAFAAIAKSAPLPTYSALAGEGNGVRDFPFAPERLRHRLVQKLS